MQSNESVDYVKRIFDTAIGMVEGSRIPLEFRDEGQRDSFRVRFYNEKKKYSLQFGEIEASAIICQKQTIGNRLLLIIKKVPTMSTPFVITPDGEAIEIDMTPELKAPQVDPKFTLNFGAGPESEEDRRKRLMAEEGINEDES
jgi:hypothetical protein